MQAADSLAADTLAADTLAAAQTVIDTVTVVDTTVVIDTTRVAPIDVTDVSGGASLLAAKLESWFDAFVLLLPNFLVAILIVVAGAVAARLARRVVTGVMHRVTDHAPAARNVVSLLATLAYVLVLAAAVFFALRVVGLDGIVTTLLAGAGIVGLALGFAFQDIAANFIAGVLMAVRNPFVVGQVIETNTFMGVVQEISLRSTIIETFTGQKVILPNAKVFGDAIVNYSALAERRVDVSVGVGYGDDLEKAERVATAAVEALPMRNGRDVQLYYTAFGESSIDFTVRFWIAFDRQTDFLGAQSAAIIAVQKAFAQNGITIPFPIRTLDFGPNGGVPLGDALGKAGGQ